MEKLYYYFLVVLAISIVGCEAGGSSGGLTQNSVVAKPSLSFDNQNIRMLSDGINDNRYRTITMNYTGEPLADEVVANIFSSDSQNLPINTKQCKFNAQISSCEIKISTGVTPGAYTVSAQATGFDIFPAKVQVHHKGALVFNRTQLIVLPNQKIGLELDLNSDDNNFPELKVNLVTSGNIQLDSSICEFKAGSHICQLVATASEVPGNFQISIGKVINPTNNQEVAGYANTLPVDGMVVAEGTIVFDSVNQINLLTQQKQAVMLKLIHDKPLNQKVVVNLAGIGNGFSIDKSNCTFDEEVDSCEVIIAANDKAGTNGQITASAPGYQINPLTVKVLSRGSLVFAKSEVIITTNDSYEYQLSLVGADKMVHATKINFVSTGDILSGVTECIVSSDSPNCLVRVHSSEPGEFQITAKDEEGRYYAATSLVKIVIPGTISWSVNQLDIDKKAGSKDVILSLSPSTLDELATISLVNTSPDNIAIDKNRCILSKENNYSCQIKVSSIGSIGRDYQIQATRVEDNLPQVPLNIRVYSSGELSFGSSSTVIVMPYNAIATYTLSLHDAEDIAPVHVVFNLPKDLTADHDSCDLSTTVTSCNIVISPTNNPAMIKTYSFSAEAHGYGSQIGYLFVEKPGSVSWNDNFPFELAYGSSKSLSLNLNKNSSLEYTKVTLTAPDNVTVFPEYCELTAMNPQCTIQVTANADQVGAGAIQAKATNGYVISDSPVITTYNYIKFERLGTTGVTCNSTKGDCVWYSLSGTTGGRAKLTYYGAPIQEPLILGLSATKTSVQFDNGTNQCVLQPMGSLSCNVIGGTATDSGAVIEANVATNNGLRIINKVIYMPNILQ